MQKLTVESSHQLVGMEGQLIEEAQDGNRQKGNWACIWFNPPYKGQVEIFIGSGKWVFQNGYGSFDLYDGMSEDPVLTLPDTENLRNIFLLQVLQGVKSREHLVIRTEPYNVIEYFYAETPHEIGIIDRTVPDCSEIHGIFFIPKEELSINSQG